MGVCSVLPAEGIVIEILGMRRCASNRGMRLIQPDCTHGSAWPGQPWHRIHVDYAGPPDGKMVLVIVDSHSKYIDAHIVNAATSCATITKLRQTFPTHGLPSVLVSENATCFKSSEFEEFCRLNAIQHVTSAPFRPASNGAAERAVQMVKAGLRKTEGRDMETRLYRFLLLYRVTPQATTGQAPAELLMRRKPRTRKNLVKPDIKDTVLRKQGNECDTSSAYYTFYTGDVVWAMNFAGSQGY